MLFDAVSGFALGLSLILAIGAQNVFVIRQGLRREHVFAVALTCAVADAFLIALGVAGLGLFINQNPWIGQFAAIFGAAFLLFYGYLSAEQAIRSSKSLVASNGVTKSRAEAIVACLALAFLNPHVYLDTVVLLGSISTQYQHSYAFGTGAVLASFFFFFSIGFGSRQLSPLFSRPMAWRVFDGFAAIVMWTIASLLLKDFVL